MNTLHLVEADHRETAKVVPIFDLTTMTVHQIREALLQAYGQKYGPPEAVEKEVIMVQGIDGTPDVRTLLFRPKNAAPRGAILHIHGGGWIGGTPDMMAGLCAQVAEWHDILVLSVDYRLVPEAPGDAALDDCFAAFSWLHREASELGVAPDRIAVMGDSAGGSLSASVALMARETGLPLAAQLLLYPALDERTGGPNTQYVNPNAGEFVVSGKYLHQLWQARLAHFNRERLAYLAPIHVEDLTGLAPAFIAVGSLDILVDESIDYAARLGRAGVPIDLRVYSGVYHAFDLVPGVTTDRFMRDLSDAIERFLK